MDADSSALFLLRSAPYGGTRLKAGLDAVLGFAVFGRQPTVLFSADAVLALCPRVGDTGQQVPNLRKLIDSFPLYDVETIWVDEAGMARHRIDAEQLPGFARIATRELRRGLLDAAPAVLTY